jgi:hypothetical protein
MLSYDDQANSLLPRREEIGTIIQVQWLGTTLVVLHNGAAVDFDHLNK